MSSQEIQKKIRLSPGASALIINALQEYLELMDVKFIIKPDNTKQG
jgi:hypothetical protein